MGRLLVTSLVFLWAILSMCCGYKIARSTTCDIINDRDKEDCGYFGIDEPSCLSRGCCWNPEVDTPNVPWCYKQAEVAAQVDCDVTHGGNCYKFFNELRFWKKARQACQAWGGYLVEITSSTEMDALKGLLKEKATEHGTVWIGAHDLDREQVFVWDNSGTKLNDGYTNWHYGEPNNSRGKEDCAGMKMKKYGSGNGKWNDLPCNDCGLPYICEKRIGK